MKENQRKELEAKLHQLIALIDKPEKQKSAKTPSQDVKVIRRRKGNPDLHIT